jgi:hypothetical protein
MQASPMQKNKKPNQAVEPTIIHVTNRAPSSTLRAMYDRGSLLTLAKNKMPARFSIRPFVDRLLCRVFFPQRPRSFRDKSDTELFTMTHQFDLNSPKGAGASLELEVRAWLREFWSRSIVAWIAIVLSAAALIVSIVSLSLNASQKKNDIPDDQSQTAHHP